MGRQGYQRLFLPLPVSGGLCGATGICGDLVQHSLGLYGADAIARGQDSGGEMCHGGTAVRPAGCLGTGGGGDIPRAGLAEVPQERRVSV